MNENKKYIPGLVSIIIPVYNTVSYIEKSLNSVLEQSYSMVEIVVVDDGSTDGSAEVIDKVLLAKDNVQVFHIENHGVSYARNLGLSKAKGEFVTFMDSDDLIGPDYIADLVRAAVEGNSELVISGYTMAKPVSMDGGLEKTDDSELNTANESEITELVEELSTVIPHGYKQGVNEAWAYRICACWGRLYKHEVWDRYRVQYEEGVRGEDVPISLFMNAVCRNICIIEKADYYYIQHEGSAMAGFRGLKKYRLPYGSMKKYYEIAMEIYEASRNSVQDECGISDITPSLSRAFYEYGYLRAFAQFAFDLARGADKEKRKELCDFIEEFLREDMPEYRKNYVVKHSRRFAGKDGFSPVQRTAVRLLVSSVKLNLLYPLTSILPR